MSNKSCKPSYLSTCSLGLLRAVPTVHFTGMNFYFCLVHAINCWEVRQKPYTVGYTSFILARRRRNVFQKMRCYSSHTLCATYFGALHKWFPEIQVCLQATPRFCIAQTFLVALSCFTDSDEVSPTSGDASDTPNKHGNIFFYRDMGSFMFSALFSRTYLSS